MPLMLSPLGGLPVNNNNKPQQQAQRTLQGRRREEKKVIACRLRIPLLAAILAVGLVVVFFFLWSSFDYSPYYDDHTATTFFLATATADATDGETITTTLKGRDHHQSNNNKAKPTTVVVVAYAITLTNCSSSQSSLEQHYLVDAAAVLKHSIHLTSKASESSRYYSYQMYAFVNEEARNECSSFVVPTLRDYLGYKILWKSTPFTLQQLRSNPILQQKIHNQGCCQEKEFIKLYTLLLHQHEVAVHLDVDTLLLKPLDHLYDALLFGSSRNNPSASSPATSSSSSWYQLIQQHIQPHNAENDPTKEKMILPSSFANNNIQSFFTRDYNMAMPNTKPTRVGMQGGFWIVKPNQTIFDDIVSLVVNHSNQYGTNCGWGGCNIGRARFYGGAGFQGVISYYYSYFFSGGQFHQGMAKEDTPPPPSPPFVELNRCLYNSMADSARKGCSQQRKGGGGGDVVACNNCNETDFLDLYGAHFTICQKPWLCGPYHEQQLCYRFHHAWHAIRRDFEQQQQQQAAITVAATGSIRNATATTTGTRLIDLDDPIPDHRPRKRYADRIVKKFPEHCKKRGHKGYIPINLTNI